MRSRAVRPLAPLCLAVLLAAPAQDAHAGPKRYLVFPFENLSSEPSLSWLGEALAMSLEDRLELLGMRTVGRTERLDALEDLSLPAGVPLTLATTTRVAVRTRAVRLVMGSFDYHAEDGVMVKAWLLDLEGLRQIWRGGRSGSLANIFTLMDPLVVEAAAADGERVSPRGAESLAGLEEPPLPLYEILVRSLSEEESEQRLGALAKGLTMDPRSLPLMRALVFANADAGRVEEAISKVRAIPQEKVARDWRLHLLEARLLLAEGDVAGALEAASRSIVAGESADAHLLMARLLSMRGEADRALAELELAEGLDPEHPEISGLRSMGAPASR